MAFSRSLSLTLTVISFNSLAPFFPSTGVHGPAGWLIFYDLNKILYPSNFRFASLNFKLTLPHPPAATDRPHYWVDTQPAFDNS